MHDDQKISCQGNVLQRMALFLLLLGHWQIVQMPLAFFSFLAGSPWDNLTLVFACVRLDSLHGIHNDLHLESSAENFAVFSFSRYFASSTKKHSCFQPLQCYWFLWLRCKTTCLGIIWRISLLAAAMSEYSNLRVKCSMQYCLRIQRMPPGWAATLGRNVPCGWVGAVAACRYSECPKDGLPRWEGTFLAVGWGLSLLADTANAPRMGCHVGKERSLRLGGGCRCLQIQRMPPGWAATLGRNVPCGWVGAVAACKYSKCRQ